SPSGLTKTYSAAQNRSAAATSDLRSASSYSRMDSRSSASALLVAAELDSSAVAAAGARRISVRNDSKQSRFRIMGASFKHADVRAPSVLPGESDSASGQDKSARRTSTEGVTLYAPH